MQSLKLAAMAVFVISLAPPADAGERRQAGAHQHGLGKLTMAVEGDRAQFELWVPGADIVGFEYAAKTEAEKATLSAAKKVLGDPAKIVALPEAAGCVVDQSFVHYTKDPEHAGHHEREHGGEHHGEHHDGHAGHQEGHAEFHVGFQVKCLAPEQLTTLTLGYFNQFPNAKSLQVKIATDKGLAVHLATRDKPTISVGATM